MSNLTESYFIMDVLKNARNENWYDKVYLCVEKNGDKVQVNGFNCYTFTSFLEADSYCKKMNINKEEKRTTMIPVCKWVPSYFHKYILNKTLQKLYWHNSISIFKPINMNVNNKRFY